MIRTVKCKLEPTKEQADSLQKTLIEFADACNKILQVALEEKKYRAFDLHHLCYRQIRENSNLTANHVVRALARVAASFGKGKKPPKSFKPTPVDLDARLFSYNPHLETVSVSSVEGRLKGVRLKLGEYQRQMLQEQKPTAATLVFNPRRKKWSLHISVEHENASPNGDNTVDCGINRIVATSDVWIVSGRNINRAREKFQRIKASLQSHGTKGSKRVLKRLSGKQRLWTREINHVISKQLVKKAIEQNAFLVFENLEGIRVRAVKSKRLRKMLGSWSFYELQTLTNYKAALAGIAVKFVNPAYTSKACSQCGCLGVRKKHKFSCSCGYVADAELNAASNIALLGLQSINLEASC